MTRAVTFTKAQVRRAVQATADALPDDGRKVRSVRVYPDGSIEVIVGEIDTVPAGQPKELAASWDDL